MGEYTREELEKTLQVVASVISRCEKMQLKFLEGTSQYSLLKNRIKALYISKSLLMKENVMAQYSKADLEEALPPVSSIINKCEKAQQKFKEGTTHHTRFKNMINAMYVSKALIVEAIENSSF